MNAGTTGSNALMRVHGSNRPVWFIKADDGNEAGNTATVTKSIQAQHYLEVSKE